MTMFRGRLRGAITGSCSAHSRRRKAAHDKARKDDLHRLERLACRPVRPHHQFRSAVRALTRGGTVRDVRMDSTNRASDQHPLSLPSTVSQQPPRGLGLRSLRPAEQVAAAIIVLPVRPRRSSWIWWPGDDVQRSAQRRSRTLWPDGRAGGATPRHTRWSSTGSSRPASDGRPGRRTIGSRRRSAGRARSDDRASSRLSRL
jgi:hypothetical protein